MILIVTRKNTPYWKHAKIGDIINLIDAEECCDVLNKGWAKQFPSEEFLLKGATNGLINIPHEWFDIMGWKINDVMVITESENMGNHKCKEMLITRLSDYEKMLKAGDFK